MLQAIPKLSVLTLSLFAVCSHAAGVEDIPIRSENRAGRLILSSHTEVQITRVVAGFWGGKRIMLKHDGEIIWTSPVTGAGVGPGGLDGEYKFIRVDVDGDNRPDWLALFFPRGFSAPSAYGKDFDSTHAWTEEETQQALTQPWDGILCTALGGLVVLNDEKTTYVFSYKNTTDPFMNRNPWVQGEKHYKMVANGTLKRSRFEASSVIPPKIWSAIQKLVEEHSCSTIDRFSKQPLPLDQRIQWNTPPEYFGLDWRPYFEDGLAMYRRAKQYYEDKKSETPREDLLTKKALGVFDLHAFFEAFPFDEIDPDNKSTEYTAMLNDFAFYQMAPENATEAVGFENQRKRVEPGVVAILAHVLRRDPKRTVAWLNLADAIWRNGEDVQAAGYYRQYADLMRQSGSSDRMPKRVAQRMMVRP